MRDDEDAIFVMMEIPSDWAGCAGGPRARDVSLLRFEAMKGGRGRWGSRLCLDNESRSVSRVHEWVLLVRHKFVMLEARRGMRP